ncbi:MAG: HEPN domain-containing protein [Bacteroidia bacterium]|nr:HEPN domain-containing protein [Bacteroidia bacterium]MDW8015216.1 HEPN domain-containing protein [Bacteroidia bacterium]
MGRADDWLSQAEHNLNHARHSLEMGDYAWACFAAHQAAEAALKGAHLRRGTIAWGHATTWLLTQLCSEPNPELLDCARYLDRQYIPSRYPDAHPAGPAAANYTQKEAVEAVRCAEAILHFCKSL